MAYAPALTFADHIRPRKFEKSLGYDLTMIVAGSVLIALCSRISFIIGANVVPVTGQTFAVLLVGALLGANRGALAVLAYLAQGLSGIPVSAQGIVGLPWLLGPTGGYLLGFIAAAYITGWFAQRGWDRKPHLTAFAMTIATAVLFIPGLLWLAFSASIISSMGLQGIRVVEPASVLAAGLWPYLPGAAIKIILATLMLPMGWHVLALGNGGIGKNSAS